VIDGKQAPKVGFHALTPRTPDLEDRINGRYWFVNAYLVPDLDEGPSKSLDRGMAGPPLLGPGTEA
jgi:hypothetical protein